MKEEALKLADELQDYMTSLGWETHQAPDMIRRLVEHIEELENPIMQAIGMAFKEPIKPLSDDKIRELADKHLSYVAYDEGDGYGDIEITGELAFYDAIIEELNRKASEE